MEVEELIQYVCDGKDNPLERSLRRWMQSRPLYSAFVDQYKDKIRKKIRTAVKSASDDMKIADLRAELEVAYLLSGCDECKIVYEPYPSVSGRGPDFLVKGLGSNFFTLEVAYVRRTQSELRLYQWLQSLRDEIERTKSDFLVIIDIISDDTDPELLNRLEAAIPSIIKHIVTTIGALSNRIAAGESEHHPVPGLQDELTVEFSRSLAKPKASSTSFSWGVLPIIYTQKEVRKFGDIICDKLGQCRPNHINILAVLSDNDTHDAEEIEIAVYELLRRVIEGDEAFFKAKNFATIEEFERRFALLNGTCARSAWIGGGPRNHLWINPTAYNQIPEEIRVYLEAMD